MALGIETFSNTAGGNAFFKAVGHPLASRLARRWIGGLSGRRLAVYDPFGLAEPLAQLYPFSAARIAGVFVQDLDDLGCRRLGHAVRPVTELPEVEIDTVLVAAFDAERPIGHIAHLLPSGASVTSLDEIRLPDEMLSRTGDYLDGRNFATNFAFFRDGDGHHTRLTTANYWSGRGEADPELWCCLFDEDGAVLAEWGEALPGAGGGVVLDSAELRRRFSLGPFTGQLFVHAVRIAGHDVVKYALDTYGDHAAVLSCTHDANAWPADLYAGLPAPAEDERVILWLQNSHPLPVPAGSLGLNLMGEEPVVRLDREIAAFATYALDTRELLPEARWPRQIEVRAGKHMVRPRYEVVAQGGARRIAHVNVERSDLEPDPRLPEIANLMGKGHILPAPLLPPERFRTLVLPTPMATRQAELPLALRAYDAAGREVAARRLGRLPRSHGRAIDAGELLSEAGATLDPDLGGGHGHLELVYDFADGGAADGWLHAIFRYRDLVSGHVAETSFGAHMFNSVLTYRGEPQSYAARPPGLSTRLFLRLGPRPYETFCQLIYPASTPWHPESRTALVLHDTGGAEVARREVAIPCGGSFYWRASAMFGGSELAAAGDAGYVLVVDRTCRLFGYHGLLSGETAFSLDHMFGF